MYVSIGDYVQLLILCLVYVCMCWFKYAYGMGDYVSLNLYLWVIMDYFIFVVSMLESELVFVLI